MLLKWPLTNVALQGIEGRPPIVVLAHGIAGQKDMGLHPFAEVFAQRGMAALVFDYRNFGGSEGEPRNWVSPKRHLEDWDSALDYVRVRKRALNNTWHCHAAVCPCALARKSPWDCHVGRFAM